jgi:hypothetical protein
MFMDRCVLRGKWCIRVLSLVLFVLLTIGGCNRRPPTYVVTGTVTYRGKPVEDAGVSFMPKGMRPASARTDASGRFQLMTFVGTDGAAAGEHVVCISKLIPAPSTKDDPYKMAVNVLPKRYGNPLETPLKATVSAKGPNDFSFDLAD